VRQEAAVTVRPTLWFNLGGFVVAALFAAPQASAQANAAPESPQFEVASIRVATGPNGDELPKPVGKAIRVNARQCSVSTLKDLVAFVGNIGPGVDKTGLTGVYDFTLSWNEKDGPSLASALRDQLGLQVRPEKLPVARFVLDSAQKPTPN